MTNLTHIDADGNAVMVDIGGKTSTDRVATAACSVPVSYTHLTLPTIYSV